MLDMIDVEDINIIAKANCIISPQGVYDDDDSSLTNDTVNHLEAIHELNDDFLASFSFSGRGGVTERRLPKTHKQAMASAEAEE